MIKLTPRIHFHVGDSQILLIQTCYHFKELKRFYRFFKRDVRIKIKKFVVNSYSTRPNFQNLNNYVSFEVSHSSTSEYKVVTLKCNVSNGYELLQLFADETIKRKIERELFSEPPSDRFADHRVFLDETL